MTVKNESDVDEGREENENIDQEDNHCTSSDMDQTRTTTAKTTAQTTATRRGKDRIHDHIWSIWLLQYHDFDFCMMGNFKGKDY